MPPPTGTATPQTRTATTTETTSAFAIPETDGWSPTSSTMRMELHKTRLIPLVMTALRRETIMDVELIGGAKPQ
jgi:hypothetical protein